MAESLKWLLADVRIEHADLCPVGFVLFDELRVTRGNLVVVLSFPAVKDDMQADVKRSVIDWSSEVGHEFAD